MKVIKLDGKKTGFSIYNENYNKFVVDKNKNVKVFKNIGLTKSWIYNVCKITNPLKYKIFIFDGQNHISLDNIQKVNGEYEYYDEDGELIVFEEENTNKLITAGYIDFDSSKYDNLNKLDIISANRQIVYLIKSDVYNYLMKNQSGNTIDSIYTYGNRIKFKITGCTGQIVICTNSYLMDMNLKRKNKNEKVLPFIKGMNKYLSLYIYSIKDIHDLDTFNITNRLVDNINIILGVIQMYLENQGDTLKYIPCDMKGNIIIEGDK